MGAGPSAIQQGSVHIGRSTAEVVRLMMPVYFTEDAVTAEDLNVAKMTWDMVLNDTATNFIKRKRDDPEFPYGSCMIMFYDSFYQRLFDVHPLCKPLFKGGMKSQGKFLVKMISLAVSVGSGDDENEKFRNTLVKLTEVHNERGVKSVEYGIVGEVLFWTLRKCLGSVYDVPAHSAWVKILCRMLKVMVPVAVVFEMRSGGAQVERMHMAAMVIEEGHKAAMAEKEGVAKEGADGTATCTEPEPDDGCAGGEISHIESPKSPSSPGAGAGVAIQPASGGGSLRSTGKSPAEDSQK